jgi:hypothetical protein
MLPNDDSNGSAPADMCSALTRQVIKAGSYTSLIVVQGTSAKARKLLDGVTPNHLLAVPVMNPVAAYCMLAGLWLWHDALHECHEIVQKNAADLLQAAPFLHQTPSKAGKKVGLVQTTESSNTIKTINLELMDQTLAFWHGIMHRREGDFSNSHYWFRRVGKHPAMSLVGDGYDADALIDDVQRAHDAGQSPAALVQLQRQEWATLFNWCVAQR